MKLPVVFSSLLILVLWMSCCASKTDNQDFQKEEDAIAADGSANAQVTEVKVSGMENEYTFSVTISSPDTGCSQYADWWEVLDMDGNLIYRRILAHSHVEEQPFSRSGGAVRITTETEVYVRAHMNNSGYGTVVQKGSVSNGFETSDLDAEFAKELETAAPQPNGCAF
ncbi:hypothetical protein [Maribacter sp. 2210JD10-5]|uniref:hypothetical protein n=1 Tax=Maribacter sp. 2210JD10-5 TaxID=3386272 RepID=UPI0039BC7693